MSLTRSVLPLLAGVLLAASACAAPTVELKTSMGRIVLELDAGKAPNTVANFLKYAKEGFYNGTIFHRVIPGFMIQGGGFDEQMRQKPVHAPIQNEARNGLKNVRGSIAMARTDEPHSATSQFFINHVDNANLNYPSFDGWGYAVFGRVKEGMEIVDKIAKVSTGNVAGHQNVPQTPIVIERVNIISEK